MIAIMGNIVMTRRSASDPAGPPRGIGVGSFSPPPLTRRSQLRRDSSTGCARGLRTRLFGERQPTGLLLRRTAIPPEARAAI